MTKYQIRSTSKGFNLIELLMVVTLIGIISSIVIYTSNQQKVLKEVENAALVMTAKIREAQTSALTGNQFVAGTTPCAYRVSWINSEVSLIYVSKNVAFNCTETATIVTESLPSGVQFGNSGSVDFVLPHGKTSALQSIALQKGGESRTVCVRSNGLIDIIIPPASC